jgi:hypothetical protein
MSIARQTPPAWTEPHRLLGIRRLSGESTKEVQMADYALFIGWGHVIPGREEMALRVFQETAAFWGRAEQDGHIVGFEPFLLEPHGGGLEGFMLVYGERQQLDRLRASEEFERLMLRASSVIDELGVVTAYAGEALGRQMSQFQEMAGQLAAA